MNYLKYTQYVYLVASVFFIYQAIEIWNEDNDQKWLFIGIAVFSFLLFLFRRRFAARFEEHKNNNKPPQA